MTKFSASLASIITVRDERSVVELSGLGMNEGVNQLPDPVYGLELPPSGAAKKFLTWRQAHNGDSNVIAVSVRSIPSGFSVDTNEYIAIIAEACQALINDNGYKLLFIPQCIYEHGHLFEDDRYIADEIKSKVKDKENIFLIESNIDVFECLSLYEGAAVALCTRLHGNVFSAMQGVPVVGINYNPKVFEFHKWLDTESAVVEIDNLDPKNLVKSINERVKNKAQFIEKSKKIFEKGIPQIEKYADFASNVILQK
jgi:polysaccharide pyruvyl transferase WcaK-like protein